MFVRIEVGVRPEHQDPIADHILRRIDLAHPESRPLIRWARNFDVYWIEIDEPREKMIPAISEIFQDRVLSWIFTGGLIPSGAGSHGGFQDLKEACPERPGAFWALEKRYRPGVTDNVARTTREAFEIVLGRKLSNSRFASGQFFVVEGPKLTEEILYPLARDVFYNELIESCTILPDRDLGGSGRFHPDQVKREFPQVRLKPKVTVGTYVLDGLSDTELDALSRKQLWALTSEELRAVREYFSKPDVVAARQAIGLNKPTDVEMEVLAQTWSEHCKHKIFRAKVRYQDETGARSEIPAEVDGLFAHTIAGTTREIHKPWLLSVFHDNAGIVAMTPEDAFCIKVETHNSPSALDPYGGALTGIVGVNRDILGCGLGAKPIFNTNVFCVGPLEGQGSLPDRILHPRRILDGIRRGVEHGGNKSGIPTVNGALVFDPRYLGKPLVYCGTGGVLPIQVAGRPCELKQVLPGDRICMVGGRIGKDGIHGATFSSLAMDEASPVSAVQLGDPITQKRMADFLLEARDLGLYRAVTDNGAGGLSSSVGEMAGLSGGARIDVANAKTKYPGLRPFELVVSESQERMTLAVPPENLEAFTALAARRAVEVSHIGEFTNTGKFEILYDGKPVALLDLEFLHDGVPRMVLEAKWEGLPPVPGSVALSFEKEAGRKLQDLLSRPNIASKEWMIRQYDHEVQGGSVIKPLHTAQPGTPREGSGPNDAGVVRLKPGTLTGVAVGCGINPRLSDIDPYRMAQSVVDEAIRNVLAVGAEFGRSESVIALVDNFCWPDPVHDPVKMGWLVRACFGMREAALALGAPLVSGKDSMKNDYRGKWDGREVTISAPPTLLMTCVARLQDYRSARTADFKAAGDRIYLLGGRDFGLIGSELHGMLIDRLRERGGNEKQVVLPCVEDGAESGLRVTGPDWELARKVYRWMGGAEGKRLSLLRSAHDVSEGGLLVSVAESLLARDLGATIELPEEGDPWQFAFGEGFHSFVVSVGEADAQDIEAEWTDLGVPFFRLGRVTGTSRLEVVWTGKAWSLSISELRSAWKREGYWE